MNLKYIYTRLHVQNYLDCKLFYHNVLGLKVSLANDAQEYVEFEAGETKITILNRFSFRNAKGKATATYDYLR
jgi:predicted enzyme related to lactoylglutathione lyase